MEQELIENQEVLRGRILGIGYNTISTKIGKDIKRIYIDGLNKRCLQGYNIEDLVKHFDIEFIPTEWGGCEGFRFIEKCQICRFDIDEDFGDKHICNECNKVICGSCSHLVEEWGVTGKTFLCEKCYKKKIVGRI